MTEAFPQTVSASRRIAAPAERLWTLWVTPSLKRHWWGVSERGELFECLTEPWDGGHIAYAMRPRGAEGPVERVEGRVLAAEPGRRLVFTWAWTGDRAPSMDTTVEVTFDPKDSGTEVRVIHAGQPDASVAAIHAKGWTDKLSDLDRAASAEAAGCLTRLWAAMAKRDWDGVAACLDPDLVVDWPHSGERITGALAFLGLNRGYPGDWQIGPARVSALSGTRAVAEVRVDLAPDSWSVASFSEARAGRICHLTEHWTRHGQPPAWRAAQGEAP
jgi:uncharacterized protein YndB with AHSA1/START domain